MFSLRPMTQADAEAIALWHYPERYSFYDWVEDRDDLDELVDPARRGEAYVSVDDPDGTLIGYFSFKQTARRTITVGLGLRPDHTGMGLGEAFLAAGLDHARTRFHPEGFALSVATFTAVRSRCTSGPGSYGSVSTTTRRTAGSGSSSR